MTDTLKGDTKMSEDEKKKVCVQFFIDEDELAELKAATFCDINTQAVMVAIRTFIRNAKKEA